jgi:hypothetical protein
MRWWQLKELLGEIYLVWWKHRKHYRATRRHLEGYRNGDLPRATDEGGVV